MRNTSLIQAWASPVFRRSMRPNGFTSCQGIDDRRLIFVLGRPNEKPERRPLLGNLSSIPPTPITETQNNPDSSLRVIRREVCVIYRMGITIEMNEACQTDEPALTARTRVFDAVSGLDRYRVYLVFGMRPRSCRATRDAGPLQHIAATYSKQLGR
jgi:hypothetical protein